MFMSKYVKVAASLMVWHPLFIGPKAPSDVKKRLGSIEKRNRARGVSSQKITSPFFIGPLMPKAERRRWIDREWREKNKDGLAKKRRAYVAANTEHVARYQAEYRLANKAKIQAGAAERRRVRRTTDPSFAIREVLTSRVKVAVAKQYSDKSQKTMGLIGCSITELLAHLESQFQPGMTWEKRGMHGWHIDHIIPCAAFDLTDPDQQAMCFHYTNLRPLWAKENKAKGDKITPEAIALIVTSQETIETDVLSVYIDRAG